MTNNTTAIATSLINFSKKQRREILSETVLTWTPPYRQPKKEDLEEFSLDEISDEEIRALVINITIPDFQRKSLEERFEENFVLLF